MAEVVCLAEIEGLRAATHRRYQEYWLAVHMGQRGVLYDNYEESNYASANAMPRGVEAEWLPGDASSLGIMRIAEVGQMPMVPTEQDSNALVRRRTLNWLRWRHGEQAVGPWPPGFPLAPSLTDGPGVEVVDKWQLLYTHRPYSEHLHSAAQVFEAYDLLPCLVILG